MRANRTAIRPTRNQRKVNTMLVWSAFWTVGSSGAVAKIESQPAADEDVRGRRAGLAVGGLGVDPVSFSAQPRAAVPPNVFSVPATDESEASDRVARMVSTSSRTV